MKEIIISENDEGRRLDKYLRTLLCNCGPSFIYKMLRKKNIVLNDLKASGKELLGKGDSIKLYFANDTYEKFTKRSLNVIRPDTQMPPVIYEDEDIMIVDKPSGMLSQRSKETDISLNEICLSYMYQKKDPTEGSEEVFVPSICNRLDRNTSGLVTFAKTYRGARALSEAFRNRTVHKYYECIVEGRIDEDIRLAGSLVKDEKTNKVSVSSDMSGDYIETHIHPIKPGDKLSRLEILLITGKTHQIRAHLASIGHPILGDNKYGNRSVNEQYRRSFGIDSQMLACCRLEFPEDFDITGVAGKTISIDAPVSFGEVM
ncbi:MAG: RluA family pseudouridine synthase [Lachnospiraceae bacterium]|nr:RluA family pseudouridine synthase [Lachnospiraceae bacterium]